MTISHSGLDWLIIRWLWGEYAFSAWMLLVVWQEGHPDCKNMGRMVEVAIGYWLVRMEWHPVGWSVCLLLLIFPCTIKSSSSLLALAHPGGPGKRAIKRLYMCVCVLWGEYTINTTSSNNTGQNYNSTVTFSSVRFHSQKANVVDTGTHNLMTQNSAHLIQLHKW